MQIQNFDVFTLGIGRVIASGYAMKNCISFLLTAYLKPMQWITKNGIQYNNVRAINFELRDKWMESLADEIDDFPTDETSDEENREWYRQRAKDFKFHPITHWCSMCGDREAHYNGITQAVNGLDSLYNGVIFQFCKICRDELQMIKLQTIASRERIGA